MFLSNGGSHTIALKIEALHNVCKHFKKNDVVRMYTNDSDACFFNVARHEKFGQRSMTYKLHQIILINHEHLDMPETSYKCQAMLPTETFVSIANELRDIGGEKIVISVTQHAIQFKCKNEGAEATIVMRADSVPSNNFGVTCSEPCEETFMSKHFNRMVKAASLKQTDACLVMLEDNKPLTVAFDVSPFGAVQFFLAPLLPPDM